MAKLQDDLIRIQYSLSDFINSIFTCKEIEPNQKSYIRDSMLRIYEKHLCDYMNEENILIMRHELMDKYKDIKSDMSSNIPMPDLNI